MDMAGRDELRELRNRIQSIEARLASLEKGSPRGSLSRVGKITDMGAYPGAVGPYVFALIPQNVDGVETEGATATLSDGVGHLFAVNLGPTAPAPGAFVIYHEVPVGAFVFFYKN